MPMSTKTIGHVDFTLTRAATTGWSNTVTLTGMGYKGRILQTILRKDATLNDATTINFYVVDAPSGDVTGEPEDRVTFYQNETLACGAGSAVDAFLLVTHDPPRPYSVTASPGSPGTAPKVVMQVTVTGGVTTTAIYGRIYFERCV